MSTKTKDPMPVRALAPWFGAGRLIAPLVGRELAGCKWVGVPFCGGFGEIAEIKTTSIVCNDLHRHVINMASVVKCDRSRREIVRELSRLPFHPDVLSDAQKTCLEYEGESLNDVRAAAAYFVCCWMGRSGRSGTPAEFQGGFSNRWNANGGGSNIRYRGALTGLVAWGRIMRRCEFTRLDAFEFLDRCQDTRETGIYVDAPWPDDGDKYKHKFSEDDQRRLAVKLASFTKARVVVRFGDHPLIRELYPQVKWCGQPEHGTDCTVGKWNWLPVDGRTQTNEAKREVLILNGPSRADGGLFS